jgi:hypothetical protein
MPTVNLRIHRASPTPSMTLAGTAVNKLTAMTVTHLNARSGAGHEERSFWQISGKGAARQSMAWTPAASPGALPTADWHLGCSALLRRIRVERRANGEASSVMASTFAWPVVVVVCVWDRDDGRAALDAHGRGMTVVAVRARPWLAVGEGLANGASGLLLGQEGHALRLGTAVDRPVGLESSKGSGVPGISPYR